MRRCLAAFLIMLLPLQSAWALVAAYCVHENGSAAQHLGHHEHRHGFAAEQGHERTDVAMEAATGLSFDCDHCHVPAVAVPVPQLTFVPRLASSRPCATPVAALQTLAQAPPERPQWARLA